MMPGDLKPWEKDKKWSDRFIRQIKMILSEYLISEASPEEDKLHNTDLIVFKMMPIRIACRIRKHRYLEKYKQEFTIRCSRPSGIETELSKIIQGWGDYFFYGFTDQLELEIISWRMIDLSKFRLYFNRYLYAKKEIGIKQKNNDGSSDFWAFSIEEFPDDLVFAQSDRNNGE